MQSLWTNLQTYLDRRIPAGGAILLTLLQIVLMYIAARILIRIGSRVVQRLLHSRAVKMDDRRRDTLESLLENVMRYIIYFVFILEALQALGAHIAALLAGAGIAGVALGFGAQSLIRDVLTGFFILFEDQYGVGDVVQINGFTGTVKTIGLRLTRVQAWTGEVQIIPNGQVQQVTNYSRHNSVAVIDVGVSYTTNISTALEVLERTMTQLKQENDNIVGEPQILGVQNMTQTEIQLRATVECKPTTNPAVQRIAHQRLKEAFEQAHIQMPFQQPVVWMNPAGPLPANQTKGKE